MRSFFFGNQLSKTYTLAINLCLFMALGIPLKDVETFREAGLSAMLMWVGYWLLSVPFCIFGLFQVKKHREQQMLKQTFS
jgi:hypothetical protein